MGESGDGTAERIAVNLISDTVADLRKRVLAMEPDKTERLTLALYLLEMVSIALDPDESTDVYGVPGL